MRSAWYADMDTSNTYQVLIPYVWAPSKGDFCQYWGEVDEVVVVDWSKTLYWAIHSAPPLPSDATLGVLPQPAWRAQGRIWAIGNGIIWKEL